MVVADTLSGWQPTWRDDLAAMATRLARTVTAAELPVLQAHDLSMWAYVVLTGLDDGPVRTQAALARRVGADPTRIIDILDELQQRGLIEREPDPADRRVHLLSLTADGRRRLDSARAGIRQREEELLARLPARDRLRFLRALQILAAVPVDDLTGTGDTGPGATG